MNEPLFIPLSDLPARYGVARQTIRDRMVKLGIPSSRMDGQKYISVRDLEILDQYHQHLANGGRSDDFIKGQSNIAVQKIDLPLMKREVEQAIISDVQRVENQPDLLILIEKIVSVLKPIDHLSTYRAMDEACQNEWVLTSEKVHELTGRKPNGDGFNWGKFRVVRCGRLGRGAGWLIVRE